jgi:hypothetical protein
LGIDRGFGMNSNDLASIWAGHARLG